MLVSTGPPLRSAMAAGLVADAPTETLRMGWLARERERARSTGNGLTYLAWDARTTARAELSTLPVARRNQSLLPGSAIRDISPARHSPQNVTRDCYPGTPTCRRPRFGR